MAEEKHNQRQCQISKNIARGALVSMFSLCYGTAGYLAGIQGLAITSYITSDTFQTQKELEAVVEEERINLNMREDIQLVLRNEPLPFGIVGCSWKIKENTYGLIIDNTAGMRRAVVQHELYHVYDGHCDFLAENKKLPAFALNFLNTFWFEPQTILYHSLGIKW